MGGEVARLTAVLDANTATFRTGLASADKSMGQAAARAKVTAAEIDKLGTSSTHTGQKARSAGGGITSAFGGPAVMAVTALGAAVFIGSKRMETAEKATAITNARLKSTGAVANTTTAQIVKLTTSIQRKSGLDRLQIQQGANVLLMYQNIRNQAGKNNDIYNRTVKVMTDMGAANGDYAAKAKALGRALNDPAAGMGLLARAGVALTKSQKDSIIAMQKSGNLLGAQKLLLGYVGKAVGDVSGAYGKTFAGMVGRVKFALMDMAANITARALPALNAIGNLITALLPVVGAAISGLVAVVAPVVSALASALAPVTSFFQRNHTAASVLTKVLIGLAVAVGVLTIATKIHNFAMAWAAGETAIQAAAAATLAAVHYVVAAAIGVATAAQWLWNVALTANPIGIIIVAIAALVAGVIYAWYHFSSFRNVVLEVWHGVEAAAAGIAGVLTAAFGIARIAVDWLAGAFRTLASVFTQVWAVIGGVVNAAIANLAARFLALWGVISGIWNLIAALLTGRWGAAWAAVRQIFVSAWNGINALLMGIPGRIGSILASAAASAASGALNVGHRIVSGISGGLSSLAGTVGHAMGAVASGVSGAGGAAASAAAGVGGRIISGIVGSLGGLYGAVKSKAESMISSAVHSLNPFSPLEHGGEIIGQRLVAGIPAGIASGQAKTTAALAKHVQTAVKHAGTWTLAQWEKAHPSSTKKEAEASYAKLPWELKPHTKAENAKHYAAVKKAAAAAAKKKAGSAAAADDSGGGADTSIGAGGGPTTNITYNTPTNNLYVTVNGFVGNEQQIATYLQQVLTRLGIREAGALGGTA